MSSIQWRGMSLLVFACLGAAAAEPKEQNRLIKPDLYGDPLPAGAVMRLGSIRLRQFGVTDLFSFSADGKTLRSLGRDNIIRHWDAASGRELRRIGLEKAGGKQFIERVWSGEIVAASSGAVELWDAGTGRHRHTFLLGMVQINNLLLSRDGGTLAASLLVKSSPILAIWDVGKESERTRIDLPASVLDMQLTPDGKRLGSVGVDGEFRLWDVASGKEVRKFRGPFQHLAFSPDGVRVASADRQHVFHVWRVEDGRERAIFKETEGQQICSVIFSPDGDTLAVGTIGETLLFDVAGHKPLRRLAARGWLKFAPEGKTLASVLLGAIRQWDVATGREIAPRPGHDSQVGCLAVTPDGRNLASIAPIDPAVRLWDLASGRQRSILQGDPNHRNHLGAYSADGKQFVSGAMEGQLRLWDTVTGRELRRFPIELRNSEGRENAEPMALALPAEAREMAAVSVAWHTRSGGHPVYQLDVWDRDTGASLVRRQVPMDRSPVRFDPDARTIAFHSRGELVVEEVRKGLECVRIADCSRWPFVFSPDGQILASTIFKPKTDPPGVPASTEGMRPIDAEAIVLTEVATGRRLLRIDIGSAGLNHLAYSPDGRTLATTDADGFRLWDAATGKELFRRALPEKRQTGTGHSFATSLAFLPPGDRLATGLVDGTVLVWDIEPKTWRAGIAAKALDGRDLERLWTDLAAEDASKAHQAVWTLAAVSGKALPFLKDHLRPVTAVDVKKVERLIVDLDSAQFEVRERAGKELTGLGEQAEPALRKALQGKPSLEARKRLEERIADAEAAAHGVVRSAEVLRTLRAIRALEAMGTAEARQVLELLADGDLASRTTRQAKEALLRLAAKL